MQKRPDEPSVELEELMSEPRTSKPAKPYSYNPPPRNASPPGACAAHLSPCCQSPSLRPHPKSTPSTPCPAPSPAAAAPHSPAISPVPPQMPKGAETQDKRGEGQPPQDYPQSLEPGKYPQKHQQYVKCVQWLTLISSRKLEEMLFVMSSRLNKKDGAF